MAKVSGLTEVTPELDYLPQYCGMWYLAMTKAMTKAKWTCLSRYMVLINQPTWYMKTINKYAENEIQDAVIKLLDKWSSRFC